MSHTATVEIEIKDKTAFELACKKLGIKYSLDEEVTLFDRTTVRGMTAYLPGWRYPAVFDGKKCYSDTYGQRWGRDSELNKLKQAYGVYAAKRAAQKAGFRVTEKMQADGSVRLVCSK